jgi:hypothetical protein
VHGHDRAVALGQALGECQQLVRAAGEQGGGNVRVVDLLGGAIAGRAHGLELGLQV